MAMIVQFPARRSRDERLASLFSVFKTSCPSTLRIRLAKSGRLDADDLGPDGVRQPAVKLHRMTCVPESFGALKNFRAFYRRHISIEEMELTIREIRSSRVYSDHIVDKAAEFIATGEVYFDLAAQFPPTIIRRPEKNVYFATTFVMVMTRFFVECHRRLIGVSGESFRFAFEHAERCDRCSLRLLQNMQLFLKPFAFDFLLVFKSDANRTCVALSAEAERFKKARRACYCKFLNVAAATGSLAEFLDIDAVLDQIDFIDAFQEFRAALSNASQSPIELFTDFVYKSRYEQFYALKSLHDDAAWLTDADAMQLEKLSLLCNSYNYLFDEALEVAEAALQKADDYDKCFFLLMSGLVLLKKKNDRRTALAKLDEGFTVAQPPS